MRRREFITLFFGTAAMWPLGARAQQPRMQVVGFLNSASPRNYESNVNAFREGLANTGYVEGRNVTIEYRWAESRLDRLPALAICSYPIAARWSSLRRQANTTGP
jgi:putative tryptophan/tyrosine transport system substrate-binding protein